MKNHSESVINKIIQPTIKAGIGEVVVVNEIARVRCQRRIRESFGPGRGQGYNTFQPKGRVGTAMCSPVKGNLEQP